VKIHRGPARESAWMHGLAIRKTSLEGENPRTKMKTSSQGQLHNRRSHQSRRSIARFRPTNSAAFLDRRSGRTSRERGAVNIELAVVIVVLGPIIMIRFLRSLANHARRARALAPPQRLQPKQGLKRKLALSQWASPERIGGEYWRN
jgi:hypothetical protein